MGKYTTFTLKPERHITTGIEDAGIPQRTRRDLLKVTQLTKQGNYRDAFEIAIALLYDVFMDTEDYKRALTHINTTVVDLFKRLPKHYSNQRERDDNHINIVYARGKCYREGAETRDFTKALKDHQTHLQLAIKLNDPKENYFANLQFGLTYLAAGESNISPEENSTLALQHIKTAIDMAKLIDYQCEGDEAKEMSFELQKALGRANALAGKYLDAITAMQKAANIAKDLENADKESPECYSLLSNYYEESGDNRTAVKFAKLANSIYKGSRNKAMMFNSNLRLANLYRDAGDFKNLGLLMKSIDKHNIPQEHVNVVKDLEREADEMAVKESTIAKLENNINEAKRIFNFPAICKLLLEKIKLQLQLRRYDNAIADSETLKKLSDTKKVKLSDEQLVFLYGSLATSYTSLKKSQLALQYYDLQINKMNCTSPEYVDVLSQYGHLLKSSNRDEQAKKKFVEIKQMAIDSEDVELERTALLELVLLNKRTGHTTADYLKRIAAIDTYLAEKRKEEEQNKSQGDSDHDLLPAFDEDSCEDPIVSQPQSPQRNDMIPIDDPHSSIDESGSVIEVKPKAKKKAKKFSYTPLDFGPDLAEINFPVVNAPVNSASPKAKKLNKRINVIESSDEDSEARESKHSHPRDKVQSIEDVSFLPKSPQETHKNISPPKKRSSATPIQDKEANPFLQKQTSVDYVLFSNDTTSPVRKPASFRKAATPLLNLKGTVGRIQKNVTGSGFSCKSNNPDQFRLNLFPTKDFFSLSKKKFLTIPFQNKADRKKIFELLFKQETLDEKLLEFFYKNQNFTDEDSIKDWLSLENLWD